LLSNLPELMSPCLHPLPTKLEDQETRRRNRHVDFLVNTKTADLIRAKAGITQYMRQFFLDDGQIEVQTPILGDAAGGAVARPFRTSATEFADRELSLRIAPELWLKRLVVGGFDRVFEIGPSFRNEGMSILS
jgi:lysyl-tRNA synthetase, class II